MAATLAAVGAQCSPRHAETVSSSGSGHALNSAAVVAHVELDPAPVSLSTLRTRRVRVDDPVYRTQKEYEGYDIGDVVDAVFGPDARRSPQIDIVFVCSDGYRATLPMAHARDGGVLATRDVSVPADVRWQPLRQGREYMLPAPYYLVWPAQRDPALQYPWPYRVVALELALPEPKVRTGDATVAHGEDVFRRDCATCHAINLQGGTLGPELNVPINVTEYWEPKTLRILIRNPALVRASSKMPAFPQLGDGDVDALVAYLTFMKGQKVELH
ncbi:MAG TPA: cytochrome c [Vicinamibacterales bacterium]|nr:cytochrome c [Vicinamibacterales bacterium]